MSFIQGIKKWQEKQTTTEPTQAPYRRLKERFAPLSQTELQAVVDYDYRPKTNHIPTKPTGKKFADGWLSRIILTDNRWQRDIESLVFLKERIEQFSFRDLITRADLEVLEPGAYIYPHSDKPTCYQLSIPLVQDDGLNYSWVNWGRGVLKNQSIYVVDIAREHAVYNEGTRCIYLNLLMGSFSTGEALSLLQ